MNWTNKGKGKYKVLLNHKTATEVKTLKSIQKVATSLAKRGKPGQSIVVRQSNPEKRAIRGYQEPNRKAFVVSPRGKTNTAKLVWSYPRNKKESMQAALDDGRHYYTGE